MSANFVRLRNSDDEPAAAMVGNPAVLDPMAAIRPITEYQPNSSAAVASPVAYAGGWRWLDLLISLSFAGLLIGSWVWQETRVVWDDVDVVLFRFTNGMLQFTWSQQFWAYANHRYFDLVGILLFGCLLLLSNGWRLSQLRRTMLSVGLLAVWILTLQAVCHSIMGYWGEAGMRNSPTLVFDESYRLSLLVPDIRAKDASIHSFPGDHGVAALCALLYLGYRGGRGALLASVLALLFVSPRLVSGAHWFSDIAVGSTSIAVLGTAVLLATPLHDWLIRRAQSLGRWPSRRSRRPNPANETPDQVFIQGQSQ